MLRSALGLISGKATSMILGFAFWLFAARLFPADAVGLTAGVIAAIMLCVQFGVLGVGAAFIVQYPRHQHRPGRLLDTSFALVSAMSLVCAALFLLLASVFFRELDVVNSSRAFTALFLAMAVAGTVGVLLDQISVAQGRGDQVLVRNVLNGLLTVTPLAAVPALSGTDGALRLFSFWVLGSLSACAWGALQLARGPSGYTFGGRVDPRLALVLLRTGSANQALTICERIPGLVLPIVVTELLSPSANAHWYTVWMMAWGVYVIPTSFGITLFAEAAHRPATIWLEARRALRSSLMIGLPAAAVAASLAGPVLSLLGESYAASGTTPLRILVVGVIPLSFAHAYFAACRAVGRLPEAIATAALSGVIAVTVTALAGSRGGLSAMAVSWVVTQALMGAWCAARLRMLAGKPRSRTSSNEAAYPVAGNVHA